VSRVKQAADFALVALSSSYVTLGIADAAKAQSLYLAFGLIVLVLAVVDLWCCRER
jgi:hypothetical protein